MSGKGRAGFNLLRDRVIRPGLCTRCGLCAGICPEGAIEPDGHAWPVLAGRCRLCGLCVACCPGAEVDCPGLSRRLFGRDHDPLDLIGQHLGHVVAHPVDEHVRRQGASGGMVSALLIFLLEQGLIDGALVVDMDPARPWRPRGFIARDPEEIVRAARSKYTITPSLAALREIRERPGRYAVVGLPCQMQGLRKLEEADPKLSNRIRYRFGLYCNCNTVPEAPLEILRVMGIDPGEIREFHFRGGPWPGGVLISYKDGRERPLHAMHPKDVMNVLFRTCGAPRCYLCMDALSEFADLSFGDFWAHDYAGELASLSSCTLITVRTDTGAGVIRQARQSGRFMVRDLPRERFSKRILNMARGKKMRNHARIHLYERQGRPVPSYGVSLPPPGPRARRARWMYDSFRLLRAPRIRRIVIRLLFSRAGEAANRVNTWRKRLFGNFHRN